MFSERPKIHCDSRQKIMTFMVTTPKLLQFLPFFANLQKFIACYNLMMCERPDIVCKLELINRFNAVISFQNSEK